METVKYIEPKLLKAIQESPETAIEELDLIYVNNQHLSILRKGNTPTYFYYFNGKRITEESLLERIQNLVLPPAWIDVRITHLPNGHLQAIGKDQKNRKQYRYHPRWQKVRNQTKFYKMALFGTILPKLRKHVERDLKKEGWPKDKVLALVVRLMEETHIRIGNEQYAKRNKTYGLSTLRKRHVDIFKDKLTFQFTGKRGKFHEISIRNKKLIHLISKCEEIPGWELFNYYDESGEKQSIDSGMVNEYIREASGYNFTAKDFRTWAASLISFNTLIDIGISDSEENIKKAILSAFDAAAKELGNTRNVCRKYYVHPFILAAYEDGTIDRSFEMANRRKDKPFVTASEIAMLELIKEYKPKVLLSGPQQPKN